MQLRGIQTQMILYSCTDFGRPHCDFVSKTGLAASTGRERQTLAAFPHSYSTSSSDRAGQTPWSAFRSSYWFAAIVWERMQSFCSFLRPVQMAAFAQGFTARTIFATTKLYFQHLYPL